MIPNSEMYPATVTEDNNNGELPCGVLMSTNTLDIGESLFSLISATRQIKSEANRLADEGDPDRGDYLWRLADEMQTTAERLIDEQAEGKGEIILSFN